MKNKKVMAILSIVLSVISFLIVGFAPDTSLKITLAFFLTGFVLSIVGVVLGFIAKKEEKILSLVGIIAGFIMIFVLLISLIGLYSMTMVNNCVRTQNETTTCELNGVEIKDIPTSSLRDDQYKDSEGE